MRLREPNRAECLRPWLNRNTIAGSSLRNQTLTMGEVIKFKKPSLMEKAEGKTLCKRGFHKWQVVTERKFDVKQGKLVTLRRCERCGKEQTKFL